MVPTRLLRAAAAALAPLALAAPAFAAVPATTAIEGVLLSAGGGPVADGNYTVTVAIYAAETGGTAVWTESGVTLAVKAGQFSQILGSKTPLSATALNLPAAWIGLQVGSDAELPRRPLSGIPFALRAAIAEGVDCSGCIKVGHLDPSVLQPFVKASELSKIAQSGSYADLKDTPDLAPYAKTADLGAYAKTSALADVAKTGAYGDLKDTPVLAKVGAACGTNLFVKGIKADGSLDCGQGGIAPDLLNEISNDLLWNQFVDKVSGTQDVAIKDGLSAGSPNTIDFPDIGVTQKIWIEVAVSNSDVSKIIIELFGPGQSNPYILYKGSKVGNTFSAKYNDTDKLDTGNLDADWLGKNIKGTWSIVVKDTAAIAVPPGKPPFVNDGSFNWAIGIQTLSSKKVQVKGDLLLDGGLQLGVFDKHPITCDPSRFGYMYANKKDNVMYVCNGAAFFALALSVPGNKESPGTSCKQILTQAPFSKTGVFWLDPDGLGANPPFEAYCDMTTAGGGWTLVFNLDTNDSTMRAYSDTDFWLKTDKLYGSSASAMQNDYKGQAYGAVAGGEVLVWAHKEGAEWSQPASFARMTVTANQQGKTFADWLQLPANTQLSTGKVDTSGSISKPGAYSRNAGDVFIDNGLPLIMNSTGKGGTNAVNTVRLGTEISSICSIVDCNGHNVQGGYGGRHIVPSQSNYPLTYEAQPSFGYHPGPMGFGDNFVNDNGCGNSVWSNKCGPENATLQVDFAVFVR